MDWLSTLVAACLDIMHLSDEGAPVTHNVGPLVHFLVVLVLTVVLALVILRAYLWIAEWRGRREARTYRDYESWRDAS